jgi:hypothetical protein
MPRLSRFGLAVAFAVALAAPAARAAEPDKLLQAGADTVAYLNVRQLTESDLVKNYALDQVKQMLAGREVKAFLEELGLNPLKDVETVWLGLSGKNHTDLKVLTICHGKFEPEKLRKAGDAAGKREGTKFSSVEENGTSLYKYQPDEGGAWYGAVVDGSSVVFANDKALVTDALKQAQARQKAAVRPELAELVKAMDEKSSLFAVSLVKSKLEGVKIPAQAVEALNLGAFEKTLPKTDSMTAVLKVTDDITLDVAFGMPDERTAADMGAEIGKVVDTVRGLVPVLAAGNPKAKPLIDVSKTLTTGVVKKNVTLSVKITGENFGKILTVGE